MAKLSKADRRFIKRWNEGIIPAARHRRGSNFTRRQPIVALDALDEFAKQKEERRRG